MHHPLTKEIQVETRLDPIKHHFLRCSFPFFCHDEVPFYYWSLFSHIDLMSSNDFVEAYLNKSPRHIIVVGSWEVDITRCRWIVEVQSNDLWKVDQLSQRIAGELEMFVVCNSKYQVTSLAIMNIID